MLHGAKTIAVVGLSGNELRASYFVGYYLKRHGYQVIPVNPRETEILGETSYPTPARRSRCRSTSSTSSARPTRCPRSRATPSRSAPATLWCQFGVINEEGNRIAEDGGVTVVVDRCLKIEHARYVGRMHWLGFNTQRITSVRTGLQ